MPPGARLIHLFSTQMPPGAGRGGETAEGALGPLSPAGTWQGSSSPPRRPGSPEDSSKRDTSYSPRSPGCRFTGTHSPPALQEGGVEVAGWGLINLVTHVVVMSVGMLKGRKRQLPSRLQPACLGSNSRFATPQLGNLRQASFFLHATVFTSVI